MHAVPVIALIDGEHHPSAVRDVLAGLDLAGVVFCGGEEKLAPGPLEDHYGVPVEPDAEEGLRRLAPHADAVVDLADEPVAPSSRKLRLAALALGLGLAYESPGARLAPPRYESVGFDGPKLAVIATGKRTGKTAVAGHWAALLREEGVDPVIVCMGRGGPREPALTETPPSLDELIALAESGSHAASDHLEDAVIARVPTVGCRRVGGGFAGAPHESNVPDGARLAASLAPGAIVFEGSGACIPPVEVDRTVCILGSGPTEPFAEYRLARTWCSWLRGRRIRLGRRSPFRCDPSPSRKCPPTRAWPSSRPGRARSRRSRSPSSSPRTGPGAAGSPPSWSGRRGPAATST